MNRYPWVAESLCSCSLDVIDNSLVAEELSEHRGRPEEGIRTGGLCKRELGALMTQAKGVLPRGEDREVLYKNPRMCGYFVAIRLEPSVDRARLESWLDSVDVLVDSLVVREMPRPDNPTGKGEKVAAVAVGFSPTFFALPGVMDAVGPLEAPVSFNAAEFARVSSAVPTSASRLDADAMFYVASVYEARVNSFVTSLDAMADVVAVRLERGYQRADGTEPFGYRDGVRNVVPSTERSETVFVHRDGKELDEPAWADGGTYMAYLKIRQHPDKFSALADDAARDAVMGRTQGGIRLDLVAENVEPRNESTDTPDGLPLTSHVRKAGPRGSHDDTQIFRRGLPFLEGGSDGVVRVGLHFCSFQASLAQFDVVFSDWCMGRQFPPRPDGGDPGPDALLDPAAGLTSFEQAGFYFVPPFHEDGLRSALFRDFAPQRKPKTGRLVVHKRITDQTDTSRRHERAGFGFQVVGPDGQPVGAVFKSDSTGRAICETRLEVGQSYVLDEVEIPIPNVQAPEPVSFLMENGTKQLFVENLVTVPNTAY